MLVSLRSRWCNRLIFSGAKLGGANFTAAWAYGVHLKSEDAFPFEEVVEELITYPDHGDYELSLGRIEGPLIPDAESFSDSLRRLNFMFSGTDWRSAHFPEAIRDLFERLAQVQTVQHKNKF